MLAFSYGAHDVGNAAGPFTVFLETINKEASNESLKSTIAITYSSIAFLLGALLWGYRIAETIGGRITPLTPATSFIVQLSTAFTVILLVGLNIPSSLTLALLGAIAGVGYARGLQYVNTRTLLEINMLWIIGVPLTILISYAFTSVSIRLL
jgi:PiT family inorganic phosphate transporter